MATVELQPEGSGHPTWREWLEANAYLQLLFPDDTLNPEAGSAAWLPTKDDRIAAWTLLVELHSRIAIRTLPLRSGDEETALDSIYRLFGFVREIAKLHPESMHFTPLALRLLNLHVRPFTAKWHRVKLQGGLDSVDVRIQFRSELGRVQASLRKGARMLAQLAEAKQLDLISESQGEEPDMTHVDARLALEMIRLPGSSIDWSALLKPELADIRKRRGQDIDGAVEDGIGLALSGGGIRSATFALGVVGTLARRGILQQVDYLSTVSGGGYFGSFLTSMLGTPGASVGDVFGNANAIEAPGPRALRNHSRYLSEGGLRAIASITGLVLFGLASTILLTAPVLLALASALRWIAGSMTGREVLLSGLALVGAGYVSTVLFQKLRLEQLEGIAVFTGLLGCAASLLGVIWQARLGGLQSFGLFLSWIAISLVVTSIGMLVPALAARLRVVSGFLMSIFLFALAACVVVYLTTVNMGNAQEFTLWLLCLAAVVFVLTNVLLDLNLASPHRFYRDRLAKTYLLTVVEGRVRSMTEQKLSTLGARGSAPYHLICAALNIPGTADPGIRDRRSDFFLFSKYACGSPTTGYPSTPEWERVNADLDLASAMAISGAAAAPNMGTSDASRYRELLALLNLRLGYWLRRPDFRGLARLWPTRYFWHELRGTMTSTLPFLNVSDGGHIENLGIYELLRRRCKFIIAVDGEADPGRAFGGLLTLVQLARIDLGVHIDPDLSDLRVNEKGVGRSHFEQFRIHYPGGGVGVLLYIKASMTGNESEYLRRYRNDNPDFPHESTAQQLYSEQQFEAYRALGEHIAGDLFRKDLVGEWTGTETVREWMRRLGTNLMS